MPRTPAATDRSYIDKHVGGQLAAARARQGLNQSEVARMLGLTFQQIQKYEKGTNRMSASVLWTLCEKMKLPITYFFEGLTPGEDHAPEHVFATMGRVGVQMADAFVGLDSRQQRLVLELAQTMGQPKAA